MLERKLFGKIETIPEAVWQDFHKEFMPSRLKMITLLNFVFRVQVPYTPLEVSQPLVNTRIEIRRKRTEPGL